MYPFSVFQISSPLGSNVYYVNTSPAVIIDGGHPSHALETTELLKSHVPLDNVGYFLATHSHPDHIGAANYLKEQLNVRLCIYHPAKNEKLTPLHKQEINLDITDPVYDHILNDGEEIILNDDIIRVIHTPGHADDHCCFYFVNRKFLFTGDLIANNDIGFLNLNKPYTEALEELQLSVAKCMKIETRRTFSGHGEAYRLAPWDKHLRKLQLLERNPGLIIPHTLISPFLFFLWTKGEITLTECEDYILDHQYLFNDFIEDVTSELLQKEFRKLVSMLELRGVISYKNNILSHNFKHQLHSTWFK